jgi:hypothetical protein
MANILFLFLFREDKGLESFLPFEEHFLCRGSLTSVVKTWQEFSVYWEGTLPIVITPLLRGGTFCFWGQAIPSRNACIYLFSFSEGYQPGINSKKLTVVPIWYPLIIIVKFKKILQQVKPSGRGIPKIPACGLQPEGKLFLGMPPSWGFYLTLAWKSPTRLSYEKNPVKTQFCKLG